MSRLRSLSNAIKDHLPLHDTPQSEQDVTGTLAFPRPLNREGHMRFAISVAQEATPKPTNFSVGAVVVDETENHVLATGFTNELPGNTHAEECVLSKLEKKIHASPPSWLSPDANLVLYTTMEPCNQRSSGKTACTETILAFNEKPLTKGITKIYYGVTEPEVFVGANEGKEKLAAVGVQLEHVPGFEKEIMKVASAGHVAEPAAGQ